MILSRIKKFLNTLKDEICSGKNSSIGGKASKNTTVGDRINEGVIGDAIVIKHGKKNSLITCWNCKKETWVLRGSKCYKAGLCGRCV